MILLTKKDVDIAIQHPKLVGAAQLAHVAWCEHMDRLKPGWGARYLSDFNDIPIDLIRNTRPMRVRVASVLAVVRACNGHPNTMRLVTTSPVVTLEEIEGNLLNPELFRLMEIANDAWDDEAFREQPYMRRSCKKFCTKYRKLRGSSDPRFLYAASQLAVLKCIPNIEVGEKSIVQKATSDGKRRVLPVT